MEKEKITVSLIKADVGGFPGHSTVRAELKDKAKERMEKAKREGLLVSYHVLNAGDDLQLLMSHRKGVDSPDIHELAWETLMKNLTLKTMKNSNIYKQCGSSFIYGRKRRGGGDRR